MRVQQASDRGRDRPLEDRIDRRALALWPGLDRRALGRCRHEPRRVAALVCRRTRLEYETVLALLSVPLLAPVEAAMWFG